MSSKFGAYIGNSYNGGYGGNPYDGQITDNVYGQGLVSRNTENLVTEKTGNSLKFTKVLFTTGWGYLTLLMAICIVIVIVSMIILLVETDTTFKNDYIKNSTDENKIKVLTSYHNHKCTTFVFTILIGVIIPALTITSIFYRYGHETVSNRNISKLYNNSLEQPKVVTAEPVKLPEQ